ncbi:hypothetical protein [Paenibacillus bouchesdurhonensis]|uniref:hypothetical protein n=1 Tax=Paenibacillus bouchesdurhonensis TaxID=1870990 RepID=UPI000DA5FBB3|nr:hypothetical protein [Paenibacillus bouchesdurhonensis]
MEDSGRIVEVKYKQYATLILRTRYSIDSGDREKCWEFSGPDLIREYDLRENDPSELIEILEDLSIEGWDLVCPMFNEDGYILRAIEFKDDTITIYSDDEENEGGE